MLSEKMYVRCPVDLESVTDPRIFICGQITKIDEFKKTVIVKIHDPFNCLMFFENLPRGLIEIPLSAVEHCSIFIGSKVIVNGEPSIVLSKQKGPDNFYEYHIQTVKDKSIWRISEKDMVVPFNNGNVDPTVQLRRYEFQNPSWFFGHAVVSKSMNILENSTYGFKELAGAKIYLLSHQVNTIMRCLQEKPCRYMLADEVGMGKTIEAISIVKIFLHNNTKKRIMFIVPDTLKEQWKAELLLKFNITIGNNEGDNFVSLKTISEISPADRTQRWDFVIIDEVHRYLSDANHYQLLYVMSTISSNILLLSATPVQQRKEEYLDLLRLLQPQKYNSYTIEKFSDLISKQNKIIQKTALILDDLDDFENEIENANRDGEDPHESEDCSDLFEEIYEGLEEICEELDDEKLTDILENISFDAEDAGVYQIKVLISYICSNYQIESNVIRNRRKILEVNEDGTRKLPTRELKAYSYALDKDKNIHEALCYEMLTDWLSEQNMDVETVVKPLLGTFFSSPWAFNSQVKKLRKNGIPVSQEVIDEGIKWMQAEDYTLKHLPEILEDPYAYEDEFCSRIVTVLNLLFDEFYDQKVVLFTNYDESFVAYKQALEAVFPPEEISFFGTGLTREETELNAYRFQNESTCRIMLCDYSGGEGRNFQCADYLVHIDLPWDANLIEQRIGRLDRLERDPARSVVTSVVIHTEESFEEALFEFWNKGLKIFTESLSGMEIIMKDINDQIIESVRQDFRYGLFDSVSKIIELATTMREAVRKEQNYDAAGFIYRPMFAQLKRLIDYYEQNENELFANTMKDWASLAGFRASTGRDGMITYRATSFSAKSAINSQLIPPHWDEYLMSEQNIFMNRVRENYVTTSSSRNRDRSICGTFMRKAAIENDYLHFFAPGDDIFDCIVNNALHSCKGRSSAFAVRSEINWKGLIFIWSLVPNEAYMLDHGVSASTLSSYKNYLPANQLVVAVDIENPESVSENTVVREFNHIIQTGFTNGSKIHLGKRTRQPAYLKEEMSDGTNIEWFRRQYPEEIWEEIVTSARRTAYTRAFEYFKGRSNIRGVKEEM